ncbi:hypothetical protein WI86_00025 [Burkholderia ubonensis]|nr:hypothetical protein WI86_00025 [Burkholderia ubonensis]
MILLNFSKLVRADCAIINRQALDLFKTGADLRQQARLIFLDRQHVVGTIFDNLSADRLLAAHRVE